MAADLWAWAQKVYARPGVEEACLELQDAHGHCVAFLLWTAWAGDGLGPAELAAGVAVARPWHDQVIAPLRAVRRALKTSFGGFDSPDQARLREAIMAQELEAERLLLVALAEISPQASAPAKDVRRSLQMAAAAWPETTPANLALERLARSFSSH